MHFQEHVEGENCDRCKPGFFNLQQKNPEGCEECFCSGKTDVCTHSHLTYSTVRKIILYQSMSLGLSFCVLSLSIVTMFFFAYVFFIYPEENVYKLCFFSLCKSSEKVQLEVKSAKEVKTVKNDALCINTVLEMCIHNQSELKCQISIWQPLFQVIIKFLDLRKLRILKH